VPLFGRPDTAPIVNYFDNAGGNTAPVALASTTAVYNTLNLFPLTPYNEIFPGNMTVSTLMFNISHVSLTATASSSSFTSSILLGIYTMSNSTRLDMINSVPVTFSKAANAGNSSLFSGGGARWFTAHSSQWSASPTLTQGRYWAGVIVRSSNFNVPALSLGQYAWDEWRDEHGHRLVPVHGAVERVADRPTGKHCRIGCQPGGVAR
jgi:hypothetical protein